MGDRPLSWLRGGLATARLDLEVRMVIEVETR